MGGSSLLQLSARGQQPSAQHAGHSSVQLLPQLAGRDGLQPPAGMHACMHMFCWHKRGHSRRLLWQHSLLQQMLNGDVICSRKLEQEVRLVRVCIDFAGLWLHCVCCMGWQTKCTP